MDKSWMRATKWSREYMDGVTCFMTFLKNKCGEVLVRCPCRKCLNLLFQEQRTVEDHLLKNGIDPGYTTWFHHGEASTTNNFEIGITNDADHDDDGDGVMDFLSDLYQNCIQSNDNSTSMGDDEDIGSLPSYLKALIHDAKTELYPGCKISRLSFIIQLLHMKVYKKVSDSTMDILFKILKISHPDGNSVPSSYYEVKKILRDLGLGYDCIDACKYDCALFWRDAQSLETCPICGTSRWKVKDGKGKKIPHKVLRYFPLIPRLQRLFLSRKTAQKMVWHKEKRKDDDYMRHPADSLAWKDFDNEFPQFADDPRNVRLALATDGFNPFGNLSNTYSMWPIILMPLNLPPWDCMKQPFFFLSTLIPGPKSPGKDIDVYMQPLIEELNELWGDGVETYDVSCKKNFKMHAAILWTINDFPAYGDLSGWSTKGYMACPVCNEEASSLGLRSKICYMGHRRFLPKDHTWRRSRKFNGKREEKDAPRRLTGDEVLQQLLQLGDSTPGKSNDKKRKRMPIELNWTKRSIFFNLPYWSKLKLRHNLDVMHIEKNICESVLGTLLSVEGKTKDTMKARQDLEDMKIRKELHLVKKSEGKYTMPAACYVMTKKEKQDFCEFLKSIKFPDGYASNISRCVSSGEVKISALKSHDFHVLLQRILAIGLRGRLKKEVSNVLAELGHFFQRLCCKKLKKTDIHKMRDEICLILCKLETLYPPAFFDVMVHLAIHLPDEALLGGPVQYRWMYPIERLLFEFKQSVRNKAHPEGSIAEAYIAKECLTFCLLYLRGIETRFNREDRNHDLASDDNLSIFSQQCRPFGATKIVELSEEEFSLMQWFVFQNCEEVNPFFIMHREELRSNGYTNIDQRHKEEFPIWFKKHMMQLYHEEQTEVNESLYSLACSPHKCARKYTGCIVNGVRFLTVERDSHCKTQNSGITVGGNHGDDVIDFYGILNDIILSDYVKDRRVVIFKCDWFDLGRKKSGIRKEGNFTSVNITRKWYENDPYVLADQVSQVFYVNDPKLGKDWRIVLPFQHRHVYDVDEMHENEMGINGLAFVEDGAYQENESDGAFEVVVDEMPSLNRDDIDPEEIEASTFARFDQDETVDVSEENEIDDLVNYCSSDEHAKSGEDNSDDDN